CAAAGAAASMSVRTGIHPRMSGLAYCSSTTTIDLGGSSTVSFSPDTRTAVNGAGWTAAGWSNVLCAFSADAVSTRPDARDTCAPAISPLTVQARLGSRFVKVTWTRPSLSRDADPLTVGIDWPSYS